MLIKMKEKVFKIEDAQVSCTFDSFDPDRLEETYLVEIKIENRVYSIYENVRPFEADEAICQRAYSEWREGKHNDVIPEFV